MERKVFDMDRISLKMKAKEQIQGNIWMLFLIELAIFVVVGAASTITAEMGGVGGFIIAPAFAISQCLVFLNLAKQIKPQFSDTFEGFDYFGKSLVLYIIMQVFISLWSLLLIIPGIIKTLSYSMAMFILAENKEIRPMDALRESTRIMDGHKMDYFVLMLSFIPWILLSAVTFGIAAIYVIPYMNMTTTNFYLSIKDKPEAENVSYSTVE